MERPPDTVALGSFGCAFLVVAGHKTGERNFHHCNT
jgi:hypothetical protein